MSKVTSTPEACGHAHRAGVEPLDQMRPHDSGLLVRRWAGFPTHGCDLDGEMGRLRYEVIWGVAPELRQVAPDGRPVPPDVGVAVEDLEVVLHLAQPIRRKRGPAEPVRRHQLGRDAIEDPGELVDTTETGELRVDVDVDEAWGNRQSTCIDHPRGVRPSQAVDRHDTAAGDPDI